MQQEDVELRSRAKETKAQDGFTVDVDDDSKSPTPTSQTRTRRLFSMSQLFAFSLTYMGTWEAWHQSIYSPLYNGGPRAIFWGGFLTVAGALTQAASIAEMSSLQPVAGAQYHWTYLLAPKSVNRFMCYLQGWASWFGYVALLAGVANTTAIQLEGIVQFNHESYVPGGWHTSVIVIALLVVLGGLNMYAFQLVPWIELTGGVLHVANWVAFIVIFAAMGPRHDPDFLFVDSTTSGWVDKPVVSWHLGVVALTWALTGFDSAIHMSEETKKAKSAVPRAIFWSIFMNGCMAIIQMAVFLISMGPVDVAMQAYVPSLTVLYNTVKSKSAATAVWTLFWFVSMSSNLASIASVSRLSWAWARDGGLPIYFAYIDPKRHVPVRAVVLCVILTSLLCLLNIGSSTYVVFNAITSLCSWALYLSYAICILSMKGFVVRRPQIGHLEPRPVRLPINVAALLYTLYMMVWLPFPSTTPVDAATMNYCAIAVAFILVFTFTMWFGWARKNWPGPNLSIRDYVIAHS
ncbi:GABA permease [Apiospora phragmitis]|uniref:GABA permease n=1 Tax=Apiospora phragmitis TaxID=2905665 RepID=A0ABR1UUZ6_9PEZI